MDSMLSIFLMIPKNKLSKLIEDSDPDVNIDRDCWTIKAKHKRLKNSLRLKILAFYYQGKVSRSKISEDLFIPYSTVCLVIRRFEKDSVCSKHWFNSSEVKISKSKLIRNLISKYIESHNHPFSSIQISKYIKDLAGVKVSRSNLITYMKNNLRMSFKRVSGRPVQAFSQRNLQLKSIFLLEFANLSNKDCIFVNVDEVIFSNSTKWNYSWGLKGKVNVSSNIGFTGSLGMFGAFTSKGDWFFSNLTQNNNSEEFIKFINRQVDWLLDDLKIKIEHLVLMIDNSPVHTSRKSMKNLKDLKCQMVFLPPYWPQLAPIEMTFNVMKRKICKHSECEIIKLCLKDGMRTIKEVLATFTNGQIVSFWTKTMKEVNEWLEDLGIRD